MPKLSGLPPAGTVSWLLHGAYAEWRPRNCSKIISNVTKSAYGYRDLYWKFSIIIKFSPVLTLFEKMMVWRSGDTLRQ